MILLQLDSASHVNRFFDVTPDSVYGLLVGGMALVVVALWLAYQLQVRSYTNKLIELNVSCVQTLNDLSNNLIGLRDAGVNMTEDLKENIDRTREHLALKIDTLQNLSQSRKDEK